MATVNRLMYDIMALAAIFMVATIAAPAPDTFEMIVLHNNDMHARFEQTSALGGDCASSDAAANNCYGGFARTAHEVRKYRLAADNGGLPVVYLNAGDTYTGTPWFSIFKDNITAAFLNILVPDAISLGNHEFDEGVAGLAPFLNAAQFPVLAANLDISRTPELAALKHTTVLNVRDTKVGIIGYLTPETKYLGPPNDVQFNEEIATINKEAATMKANGVNIIIALGHSGLSKDKEIAANCADIDMVIGGHSHTFLYEDKPPSNDVAADSYPVVVTQSTTGKKVLVVQAFAYTKYLGFVKLTFSGDGDLITYEGAPILLNATVPQDSDVLALLEVYRPAIVALKSSVIGRTKVQLDGASTSCRTRECNLGNMLADSMVYSYAMSYSDESGYWTDAPIAFIQGGGIRSSIEKKDITGNITRMDLLSVLPFRCALVSIQLSGRAMRDALEWAVHKYGPDQPGEFLQMSGVHVVYNLTRPSGERVISAKVTCGKCLSPKYDTLKDDQVYKILVTDFLALGGDGFEMFKTENPIVHTVGDADAAEEYIKKYSPVHPAVEWRITIHGAPTNGGSGGSTTPAPLSTTTDANGRAERLGRDVTWVAICVAIATWCLQQFS